jgi:hypothetical protein
MGKVPDIRPSGFSAPPLGLLASGQDLKSEPSPIHHELVPELTLLISIASHAS